MRKTVCTMTALATLCSVANALLASPPPTTGPAADELAKLAHTYFTESDASQRRTLAAQIERLDGVTVDQVAQAISHLTLWEPQDAGRQEFTFQTTAGDARLVQVQVPKGYEPDKPYPLIIALHWARDGGEGFLDFTLELLGDAKDEYLVAAPRRYRGMRFNTTPAEAAEPVELLRQLRKRYHVDTDRIYVVGYSMGGQATCTLTTLYTHWFAGGVSLSGTIVAPYLTQAREILMPNLADLPMVLVWGERDVGRSAKGQLGLAGIAGANRDVLKLAGSLGLPIQGFEVEGIGHQGITPPHDALIGILQKRRDPAPKTVSHWFRYPVQGRMRWLQQAAYDGKPWTAPQLAIRVPGDGNYDAYVTKTLKSKLAYIGGTIQGQRIDVETTNTSEVEIRLNSRLVNLNEPLLIYLNGKQRLHATAKPKIATMLKLAYDDWEFQQLYTVRLTIGQKGMARQR